MRYNLESMKHFGVKADAAVLWDTFTSVVGSERMTVKKVGRVCLLQLLLLHITRRIR